MNMRKKKREKKVGSCMKDENLDLSQERFACREDTEMVRVNELLWHREERTSLQRQVHFIIPQIL